jgi:Bacterial Ig-like domain (group 2)
MSPIASSSDRRRPAPRRCLGLALVAALLATLGAPSVGTGEHRHVDVEIDQATGSLAPACGIPVAGIVIVPDVLTMRVGAATKARAYLVHADGRRDDITKRVVWELSNLAVSTVDRQEPNIGQIYAHAPGTATISADDPLTGFGSADPGGTSLTVTVTP